MSQNGWTTLRFSKKSVLHLLSEFVGYARDGISLNMIVFRHPMHIFRSDDSEFGLGGYNILSGKAWRFKLPIDCHLRTSLNLLEFLAGVITIWTDFLSGNIDLEYCILSQADSTSAAGWLRISNFAVVEDEIVQMITARHLASLVIKSKCCLYSQWFLAGDNVLSDALSRDFHLSHADLSSLISSSVPEQVPFGIQIQTLPNEICSWLTCLLRNQPFKTQWSKEPTQSKLGLVSIPTSSQSVATMMHNSSHTQKPNVTGFSWHLLTQAEKVDLALNV